MENPKLRLRAAFYQFRPIFGRIRRNLDKVVTALDLDEVQCDLVVLPELAFTGYHFQNKGELLALAEDPQKSTTVDALSALCRKRDFHIVTGFAERARDHCFNSALLIGPRGLERTYRKLHLFSDEKQYFQPGDLPLEPHFLKDARIGMMVCFDWLFPEVARVLALAGTDLLCHPSNLVLNHCQAAMRTRCLENGVYAITTNRTGSDVRPHGTITFTGRSQITAPDGKALLVARVRGAQLGVLDLDLDSARDKAITPRNHKLLDRRPERYQLLTTIS